MLHRLKAVVVILSFVLLPGCGREHPPTLSPGEVEQFVRAFVEARNKGDIRGMMQMFDHSPEATSVTDGEVNVGWDAINSSNDDLRGGQGALAITLGAIDVMPLETQGAVVVAPIVETRLSDSKKVEKTGALSLVLEKTPAGWKILHAHLSFKPAAGDSESTP